MSIEGSDVAQSKALSAHLDDPPEGDIAFIHPMSESSRPAKVVDIMGSVARRFLEQDPEAMAHVEGVVKRVVRYEGYAIPGVERQDLAQDILLQLWQAVARPNFDHGRSFEAFIRSVACRRCIDWRRRRRPVVELKAEPPDSRRGPEEVTSEAERLRLGCRILARLGPACRELIRLHAVEGKTYGEIASMLGRSEGALRVQMHTCLKSAKAMRTEMDEGER